MAPKNINTPTIVKRAIEVANKAEFSYYEQILMTVLGAKEYNETLDSLNKHWWDYIFMLYEYKMVNYSVEQAWSLQQENDSKNNK